MTNIALSPRRLRAGERGPTRYGATRDELGALLADQPRYRVDQLWQGLYRGLRTPSAMTNLPRALREHVDGRLPTELTPLAESVSSDGDTVKFLSAIDGGYQVETVLMVYRDRATVCVSSQAGCAMGCGFCATGQAGFDRHLTTGEIVEQVVVAARRARAARRRLSNVVFMGMGEPLANEASVWAATQRIHDDLGLSARHITLSTVGIVPGIRALAARRLPVTLAVSIHAANDVLRDELVPINRRYPLDTVVEACQGYIAATGRRVSFEWAMIDGVNDRPADAAELAALAQRLRPGGARQPDPAQPDAGLADDRLTGGAGAPVPRVARRSRDRRHGAAQPRHRHRRRLRPVARRGCRPIRTSCDPAPAVNSLRSGRTCTG